MTDTAEELRIIGKDSRGLAAADRAVIARAADECELTHRALLVTNQALIETRLHNAALSDQIRDMKRQGIAGTKFPSISSGWLTVRGNNP